MAPLRDKISQLFGVQPPASRDEDGTPRDENGRLKLRSAQEARGGPLISGIDHAAQGMGNMSIRAGANYLTMATGNPGYAQSAEDIISGLDAYADEVHMQTFLNREGKWIQQEIEDIATESRNMMKNYSVRIDEASGNPLAPDQPVPDGMKVTEKTVYYNSESGKPFSPLDKSTWIDPGDPRAEVAVVGRANQTYHRKMMDLLLQVNQVGATWYRSSPSVGKLVGTMTGQYIQTLEGMFNQGQKDQQTAEKHELDMREGEARVAASGFAEGQQRAAGRAAAANMGGAPPGGPPSAGLRPTGTAAPGPAPGAAGLRPAPGGPAPQRGPSKEDVAANQIAQASRGRGDPATDGLTSEGAVGGNVEAANAVLANSTIEDDDPRVAEAHRIVQAAAYQDRMDEQGKRATPQILERVIDIAHPGIGGRIGVISALAMNEMHKGEMDWSPKYGVTEATLTLAGQYAEELAKVGVRRQKVLHKLENGGGGPEIAKELQSMGPGEKEVWLNDWLEWRQEHQDPNIGGLVFAGGSLGTAIKAYGKDLSTKFNREITTAAAAADNYVSKQIDTNPVAFAAEMADFDAPEGDADFPLAHFAENPIMGYREDSDNNGQADQNFGFIKESLYPFVKEVFALPAGSAQRKARWAHVARQADRGLKWGLLEHQTKIENFTGIVEDGQPPSQDNIVGQTFATSAVVDILLDKDLKKKLSGIPGANALTIVIGTLVGEVDRRFGEERDDAKRVSQEMLQSEAGFAYVQQEFKKRTGQDLTMEPQAIFNMLQSHNFSYNSLDEARKSQQTYIEKLQAEQEIMRNQRREVRDTWIRQGDPVLLQDGSLAGESGRSQWPVNPDLEPITGPVPFSQRGR